MQNLRVLERKDKKRFLEILKKQFDFDENSKRSFEMSEKQSFSEHVRNSKAISTSLSNEFDKKLDYVFLINNKNKVFIVNKDIANIDLNKIRINSVGLYIAEFSNNEIRLSIEGSQLIGPNSKKNIIELNEKEAREWLKGKDLERETEIEGFAIIKHNNDYLGSGKSTKQRILNFIPKTRRLNVSD